MTRQLLNTANQEILVGKLHRELKAASLDIEGLADMLPQVAVDFIGTPSQADLDTAQAIIDAHDATDYEAIVKAGADAQAANIPGWATWTEQESLDWIEANVTNLASAKTVLLAMSRLLVALRNKQWPGLEGS